MCIGHVAAPVITGAITRNLKVAATSQLLIFNSSDFHFTTQRDSVRLIETVFGLRVRMEMLVLSLG